MELQKAVSTASKKRFPIQALAFFCVLLLLAGVLPLYAISCYNHPYYDDYRFSATVHQEWVQTRRVGSLLTVAWQSAQSVRQAWQGTYTGTLLSNLQPGVFSENLYWLTTVILLTAFLLCFGFFLAKVFRRLFHAGIAETTCIVSLALFLMTQLLPEANEAFFWFNGGIGNTFIYSLLALTLGLLISLFTSKRSTPYLSIALAALMILLGGGSYGGGLFSLLIFICVCVYVFYRKNNHRFIYGALTLLFVLCFAYNMSAPGNAMRSAEIGLQPSAVKAVLYSLYNGIALLGYYTTLPVFAVALALSPLLYTLAKNSNFRFRHPVLVLLGGMALFCTQLTPPMYSIAGIGASRITDTYYYSYIIMLLLYETYALGALARYRAQQALPGWQLTSVAQRGLLLLSACLFIVGCIGFKHNGDSLYGPMNMAGGSAAISLITGEAQQFDREMDVREQALNDPTQPSVILKPLTSVPKVFMPDLLTPDSSSNVLSMLRHYYDKDQISIEGSVTP